MQLLEREVERCRNEREVEVMPTGRLVEREVELFEREVDAAHEREAEQSLFRHETSHFFETDPKPFTSKSNA